MGDWGLATPFFIVAGLYLLGGPLVRLIASHDKMFVGSHADPHEVRMAKFLDWAIDVTQIASILALPVIALLFERRREEWIAYAIGSFIVVIAVVAVMAALAGAERYRKLRIKSFTLTTLSGIGVVVNVVIALTLGLGWARDGNYVEPAKDTISVEAVARVGASDAAGNSDFEVVVEVRGGQEALAGRIPWVANTGFSEGVDIESAGSVSWAKRPCSQISVTEWRCRDIYLGRPEECGLKLNIFATLASGKGVDGILQGWADDDEGGGYFPPPPGVELTEPYPFQRSENDPGCPPTD